MKILKRTTPLIHIPTEEGEEPKKRRKRASKLPPDDYKDEFEPLELGIDETRKFIFSVKRGGDLGLPCVDIRQYQTTELYTGFTKKGINFPVELLPDLMEELQNIYDKCQEKKLFDE